MQRRSRHVLAAAFALGAIAGTSRARADAGRTQAPVPLFVVVESNDPALGAEAVRLALGARLRRPVASWLDRTEPHQGPTLTLAVDRRRQRAVLRLADGNQGASERTIELPRPAATALAAIADASAALLAELGASTSDSDWIVRDVRDPFAPAPPETATRDEVPNPWPDGAGAHPGARLAVWPVGSPSVERRTAAQAWAEGTPARTTETAGRLAAPEPGFVDED